MTRSYPPLLLFLSLFVLGFALVFSAPKESSRKRLAEIEKALDAHDPDFAGCEPSSSSSTSHGRGSRQRLAEFENRAAEELEPPVDPGDQPFTEVLKKEWAAGRMSAAKVQKFATAALKQGVRQMEALAALGSHGAHASNCHRGLIALFGRPKGAPQIDWVMLPMKGGLQPHPVLYPHKYFAALYKERYDFFLRAFRGPEGVAQEYWENVRETSFFRDHPFLKHDLDNALPPRLTRGCWPVRQT